MAPVVLGDPGGVDLHGLRVAVQADNGLDPPTNDTRATIVAAADALRAAGANARDTRHPDGGHELTLEVWRSYGDEMSAAQMYGVLRRWDAFRAAMLAFMDHHDLILCPVFPGPAPRHGTTVTPGRRDPTSHTTPHSLTGWPAVTVRCGTSADGCRSGCSSSPRRGARTWRWPPRSRSSERSGAGGRPDRPPGQRHSGTLRSHARARRKRRAAARRL